MAFEKIREHGVNMYGESEDGQIVENTPAVTVENNEAEPVIEIEVPVQEGDKVESIEVSVAYTEAARLHAESLIADLEKGIAPAVDIANNTIVTETVIGADSDRVSPGCDGYADVDARKEDVGTIMESEL